MQQKQKSTDWPFWEIIGIITLAFGPAVFFGILLGNEVWRINAHPATVLHGDTRTVSMAESRNSLSATSSVCLYQDILIAKSDEVIRLQENYIELLKDY